MVVARAGFLLACVALVAGCGSALPPVGNYATIAGRVTDAATGAPLAGATVLVNSVLSATTDANGTYRIVTVPTGSWSYSASGPARYGVVAADNPPPLGPGEARTLDIALRRR
ncbi:MAG: hypothetical protein NVS2B3_14950 [Vulcanimicrobiaceae bacterium]